MDLALPLLLAALIPAVTFGAQIALDGARQRVVYKRLMADPLIAPGAEFNRIQVVGDPEPILCAGRIVSIRPGRVEVESLDRKETMIFSGIEFENSVNTVFTRAE